jgi:hypothetical protein
MTDHAGKSREWRKPSRIVELTPWVCNALNLVCNELPGEYAVREAIAGITSHNVDVLAALISTDESHVVNRFEDLPTPFIVGLPYLCEALTDSILEFVIMYGFTRLLPNFVVATA